ncbi:torso-like protein [Neocloeon triangulifer]|uniref:torso-like protein n=1 Tax=Neocloeon triangulifer TaxID=2078957 RepID=UPI00286EDE27|nr:torso-like protein [Neocloeon triangulifer]
MATTKLLAAALIFGAAALAAHEQTLDIGRAINLFSRYGYLTISMRVVPRNDSERWLFREPTVEIFKEVKPEVFKSRNGRKIASDDDQKVVFHGDFHMEFCDNVRQLFHAYFRDFNIEKLDKPWKAFTGSWSSAAAARELGINASFVTAQSGHSFILVRVSRWRDSGRMSASSNQLPIGAVAKEIENVKIGDEASVVNFVKSYGSHYVHSFVTGNALYQVFVYTPSVYATIKERLKTKGISELSSFELGGYFSPWHAVQMGKIMSASGNRTVTEWAEKNLLTSFYLYTFPSLLRLHGDAERLRQLDEMLLNEAVLQLDLRTVTPVFKEPKQKYFFEKTLDNQIKLWESNM